MTAERLAALARAATPGEWAISPSEPKDILLGVKSRKWLEWDDRWDIDYDHIIYNEGGHTAADAEYIAAVSPDVILALLERLRLLEAVAAAAGSLVNANWSTEGIRMDGLRRVIQTQLRALDEADGR